MNWLNYFQRYREPSVEVCSEKPMEVIKKLVPNTEGFVVQIGSHDGKTHDPLHALILERTAWRGLFVEPVPYLFEKLVANYPKSPRFYFEPSAINNGENASFYFVNLSDQELHAFPEWVSMLGSFKRSHILKHLDGSLEKHIEEIKIQGLKLHQLFQKYSIDKIHVLHIDAEGYDWEILKQLDFREYLPTIILFEYAHLSGEEISLAKRFLSPRYNISVAGMDFLCVLR